jgi:hypothetical protein
MGDICYHAGMKHYVDDQLLRIIEKMGKDMTSSSSTRTVAMEKERALYVKEAFRRGLLGYPCKKKYRDW